MDQQSVKTPVVAPAAPAAAAAERPFPEQEAALERSGRVEELLRLYEARTRDVSAEEACGLLCRGAELARERLKNFARAEELLRRAQLFAPSHPSPLLGLRRLYEQRQDAPGLADTLERLGALTAGEESAAHFLKAADLYEQKLYRRDRAVLCLQRATRADPRLRAAYRRVRALMVADHRYQPAFDSLERERAALGGEGLLEEYVAFAERLKDDPTEHPLAERALAAAAELAPGDERPERARRELVRFAQTWREKVRTLRALAVEERDRRSAARMSLLVAKLHAWYEPGSHAKVKEALERCFLLWPGMPDALALMERVAERNGDFPSAVEAMERMAAECKEKGAAGDLWVRAGTLRLTQLNDGPRALEAFLAASEVDPSRPDAASLAAELLLERERAREAVALLERYLATVKDRAGRVALQLRLADLCRTHLKDGPAARAHFEQLLKLEPGHAIASFELARLAADAEDPKAAAPLLDVALVAPRPVTERVALCEVLALLHEEAGDTRAAVEVLGRALALDPTRLTVRQGLREQAEKSGAHAELAVALRRAALGARPDAAAALWRELAELLQGTLGAPVQAQAAWAELLRLRPEDAEARAAVERLQEAVRQAEDPRALAAGRVQALEAQGAEPAQLVQALREWLAVAPEERAALGKLQGLLATTGRFEEAAGLAAQLAQGAGTHLERGEWTARQAALLSERLGRGEEAAGLFLGLLAEGFSTSAVTGGLERLAAAGVRAADAGEALAAHYGRSGDRQRQVAALLVQLGAASELPQKKRLLAALAETHERHLADSRAAFDARLRGVAADPTDAVFRVEAVRLARDLTAQVELARFFRDLSQRQAEGPARSLLAEAAELAEEGGAPEEAVAALAEALRRSPESGELADRLVRLYVRAGRVAEAEGLLRERVGRAPAAERAGLLLQQVDLCAELGRPQAAAEALEEALKAGADEARHLPRLCALLEQAGQTAALVGALERGIALAERDGDQDRSARLSVKRAQLLEGALGARTEAVRSYAAVLRQRPADPDALAALEGMLQEPDCRAEAARALAPAYEAAKDHRKLAVALEALSEAGEDAVARVQALKALARTHLVHLRQPELAFASLARAVRLTPADAALRGAARQAAEDADALDSYTEVLQEVLEGGKAGPLAAVLHRELADLYEKKLDDRAAAVRELQAWLALEPRSQDALRSLQRLHRAAEAWGPLAGVLERLAATALEPAEQASLLREAAMLQEGRLSDRARAATLWRQLAERDPLNREAATHLERLYGELDLPRELAFALELRRGQEGRSPQGRELAFRLARLREGRLSDGPGALQLYRAVLQEEPGHTGVRDALEAWVRAGAPESAEALEALDPVLAAAGEHARRIALREARLEVALTEERTRLSAQLRAIYERDLGQPDMAFLAGLRAFTAGWDREALLPELERLARQTGSFEELAGACEDAAGALPRGDALAGRLLRRAAELREQLGEGEEAARLWRQLLEDAPQDRQALEALGRLYEKSNNARNLSEVYARQAELAAEPAERLGLLLRAAEAFEAAGEEARAVECLRTAVALQPLPEALGALERLYARARDFAAQADVLEQLAQLAQGQGAQGEEARRGFLVRRAQLLEREGGAEEAVAAWARLLALDARDPSAVAGLERLMTEEGQRAEVARLLEPVYRAQNDLKRLVEVLDVRLQQAEPAERLGRLEEVATLREALGQKQLAFAARLRAFREFPEEERTHDALERAAAESGAFEEVAAAYEDGLEKGVSARVGENLWRRLAFLSAERLDRLDLAARALEEVARRAPADLAVLESLCHVLRRANDFRALAGVLQRRVALEGAPERQLHLLFELGQLAEETLADKALAIRAYQAVLERKGDERNALKLLARLYSETERHGELAQLLEREVQLAEARGAREEACELLVRLGRLKANRLSDAAGALGLYREVLRRRPAHPGAVGALEELSRSDSPLRGEAALVLEPVFAGGGDHLKLVQVLEARVGAEPSAAERAGLLRRVARTYAGPMGNAEMAFVAATRALREGPDDAETLSLCVELAEPAGAEEELAAVLEDASERAVDEGARGALLQALARLQGRLGEPQAAIASWKRLLALKGSDAEALDALAVLLREEGRAAELADILRRQSAMEEEPGRRASLLLQLGALQDEALKDAPAALATLRRVLELRPDDGAALARMEALCTRQERWPELADVLARRVALAQGPAALELRFRLGQVREARLMDRQGALEAWRDVLAEEPRHAGALERLEALVGREPQNGAAWEALLSALRQAADAPRLARALEGRAAVSPDSRERKALLAELGALREVQGEPELAFLALWRAYKEDPNDPPLRARLSGAADAAGSHDELVAALEEALPRLTDTAEAAEVCLVLGAVLEGRLKDLDRAVNHLERARSLSPAAAARALPALDRAYGALDAPAELAGVLEAQAELAEAPQDRVGLLFRLGQLAEGRLASPDRAAAAYERILVLDPAHLPALRLLEPLYEAAGAADKLARVLERQEALVTGAERERVLARRAQVAAEHSPDAAASIALYRELLQRNPRSEQAAQALEALYARAGEHEALRELLASRLAATVDPRELVRLNERLGHTLAGPLSRPEEALGFYRAALERDPRHRPSLEALRDLFERLGRKDDLVAALRRLVPLQEDAAGVKALRVRLAEVLAGLSRREEALDAARRALEVEPHAPEELARLRAVFAALKAQGDEVRTLELAAQAHLSREERERAFAALSEVADVWEAAGKPESAAAALERVLELDPASRATFERATRLFAQAGDWRAYATASDRFVPHLVTAEEKVAALRELARVQEARLGQRGTAFLTLCRALQLDPASDGVREEVERLAEETGSHEELAAVYESVVDALPSGPLAERLFTVLARVQDTRLDDVRAAEATYRRILAFDPTNPGALDALAAMFLRRSAWRDYVVALEQKLEAAGPIEARKPLLREVARVWDEHLEDPVEAAAALQRALDLEPDLQTLGVLTALYRRNAGWRDVVSCLLRARDLAPSAGERAALQVQAASVYERELSDAEAAVQAYRQALEFDPGSREALEALERLYSQLDRPADLLTIYERQLELSGDYREKVKVLFKSAAIWEGKYQNLEHAALCVQGVLQLEPANLQAVRALARLRRAQARWDDLVQVLGHHVQVSAEPAEQAALYVEMADVLQRGLRAVDRAVTAYHKALEVDPANRAALHALGLLYERSGNWPFALEVMQREAEACGRSAEAVEVLHRMGRIHEDMLQDAQAARESYRAALAIDPGHLPSLRALKGLQEQARDWEGYERSLREEAERAGEPQEKARALLEAARHQAETRGDREAAVPLWEEALRHQEDLADAARPLSDVYTERQDWPAAERMLDVVVAVLAQAAQGGHDEALSRELCQQLYRLGYVSDKAGKREKALASYEKAYGFDPTHLPTLEGFGHLLVQAGRLEEALKVYQAVLIHHRDDLTDMEVVEVYWQLGDIHARLGQPERADNHFLKALDLDPGHEPSLKARVGLLEAAGRHAQAAEARGKLLDVLDGEDRFRVAVEQGREARERLNDPHQAIDAYQAALRIDPSALEVMDALYVLYRETQQPQLAAEVLDRMLAEPALSQDAARAKRVWFALGELCRDALRDAPRAAAAFNAALDLDFRFVEAFSALEAMLGQAGQWRELEENYTRMLQRLPKTDETHGARMSLWRALGDLYREPLQSPEGALMAYKVVAAGLPKEPAVQETYADLAAAQPGQEAEAVRAYRLALPASREPARLARAMMELAARRKDYDGAWLAAQASAHLLGKGGEGEREILAKLAPYAKKREAAQAPVTERLWREHLLHPSARGPLAELMGVLGAQAGHLYAVPFERYGLNPRKHRVDVGAAQEYHLHHYRYVARLLGMESVELYSPFLLATRERQARRSSEPAPEPLVGVEVLHSQPTCLKVGGRFFGEAGQREVQYQLGRAFAQARPELVLTQRLAPERLEAVLQAAALLAVPGFRPTAPPAAVEAERQLLARALTEPARAALARAAREALPHLDAAGLKAFADGAELSAVRAGVLAAGELEPVRKVVQGETGAGARLSTAARLQEVLTFALSEDLRVLREAVGTSVEVQLKR
jgi:tetratricopeptide (TPR) repeat protein